LCIWVGSVAYAVLLMARVVTHDQGSSSDDPLRKSNDSMFKMRVEYSVDCLNVVSW
jgi:hypothetical protein